MSLDTVSGMLGMPTGRKKRPIRRGGGRHKGKPGAKEHHDAVNAAMAKGDHQAAKMSALALAKALHAKTKQASAAPTMGAVV